ncbi:hypothetical protein AY601_3270 [Pedobacter cryoconitis]|uniref:DUF4595 domain-containing protein n=1 Tax=Pedobacter cryoconitis TaxID=188932 RepID=A0A127VG22_9SPHI|nr:hypothetical protein [Pedobacter cryoconitis]AMQ00141.1 hypothetical protein AY601_3270 [Pedobacter cryoconitis]
MKKLLLLISVTALFVASCTKDEKDPEIELPPVKVDGCVLKETNYTILNVGGPGPKGKITYTYDSKARVVTAKYGDSLNLYSYSTDQIILKKANGATTTYKLDAGGRIVKETYSDNISIKDYTYNPEGYLIMEVLKKGETYLKTEYLYTAGNLKSKLQNGEQVLSIAYKDELSQKNFIDEGINALPLFYYGILRPYFGKASKNLPDYTVLGLSYYQNYAYKKDDKGNIINVDYLTKYSFGYNSDMKYECN